MIHDPTNQYIFTIMLQCDIREKDIIEIGCGKGRITRDLAKYAKRVVATDPDHVALKKAKLSLTATNVEFIQTPTGIPELPPESFDFAIYTLSLHHVPEKEILNSLRSAAMLLKKDGAIIVVEPGDEGSFTEAKERYGAGSGDERPAREAAIQAMNSLDGWEAGETINFRTLFQFDDEQDFLDSMLPGYRQQPASFVTEVRSFLDRYRSAAGVVLAADRRLNVLRPRL